jgi:hypothetical protein
LIPWTTPSDSVRFPKKDLIPKRIYHLKKNNKKIIEKGTEEHHGTTKGGFRRGWPLKVVFVEVRLN